MSETPVPKSSQLPVAIAIPNPIKTLATDILTSMLMKRQFEEYIPLQSGAFWWVKSHLITPETPAYKDLVKELESKGYKVVYKPYRECPLDFQHGVFPLKTYFMIKPSEYDKPTIVINNDPF